MGASPSAQRELSNAKEKGRVERSSERFSDKASVLLTVCCLSCSHAVNGESGNQHPQTLTSMVKYGRNSYAVSLCLKRFSDCQRMD